MFLMTQRAIFGRKTVIFELKRDTEEWESKREETLVTINFFAYVIFYLWSKVILLYHHYTYHESQFNMYKIFVIRNHLEFNLANVFSDL